MKKALFFLMMLMTLSLSWGGAVKAQTTGCAAIGEESTSYGAGGYSGAGYMPIDIYYNYSYEQMVYDGSEMPTAITSICFKYKSSYALTQKSNVDIYLGETTSATLSSWMPADELTLVYSGALDFPASSTGDWVEFTFNQNGGSFSHDQSKYIVVVVNDKSDDYPSSYSNMFFCYQTCEAGVHKYLRNDDNEYSVPPTSSASNASQCPIVRFCGTFPAVSCEKPSTLTATVPDGYDAVHDILLQWTGGSGSYNVQLKKASQSDDEWQSLAESFTENAILIQNQLDPMTTYDVRVQSVCSGEVSNWKSATFTTTAQATAVGDSWSDDFEGASCGWELINGTLTNQWVWGTATNNGGTHALYISNDGGDNFTYTVSGYHRVYATKLLHFEDGKYAFTFDWECYGEASSYDYLSVGLLPASAIITADNNSSSTLPTGWIALHDQQYLLGQSTWQTAPEKAIQLTAGNYYLVLRWRQDNSGPSTGIIMPAAVDNVTITRVACPYDVADLAVTPGSITTTGATVTWTAGEATQWQVAYATTSNFANATEDIVSSATYNMANLTDATHYYVKVRAYCGGSDYGSWSNVIEFDTKCLPTTVPSEGWTENFDGLSLVSASTPTARVLPTCWSAINTTTYSSYKPYPSAYYYSSTNYANSTPNCLRFYSSYSSWTDYDPQPQYAILPEMSNLDGKQITLFARGYNGSSTLMVGRMSDPTDASTFALCQELTLTTSYQEFSVELTGTGNYIALMIDAATSSRNTNGVYVDDITVEAVPTCKKPSALMLETPSSKTAHTATLKWTNGAEGQTTWQIAYSTDANFDPDTVTPVDVTTNPATIESLAQSTTYYAYVRANCGNGDYSAWNTTKATFTTLAGNAVPTGLAVAANTITSTEATASWNAVAGNTLHESYDIYWAEATFTAVPEEPAAPNFISGINTTSQLLSGLTAETEYKVWVRDNCGNDGYSAWSSAVTFTTASACQTPDGLATNSVTNNSATLSWNAYGQTGFNLQYRVSGEEWDANNIISNVNTPYSMNPILTGNTTYQVRVQAACADPTSEASWSNATSFTTECGAEQFPWSENFDNWTSKSVCWSFRKGQYNMGQGTPTTYSSAWTLNSSYGSYITIDGKALTMNLYSTNEYWAVTPAIDITTDDAVLKVDVAVAAWSSATPNYDDNDTLAFAISTDGGNTFTNLRVLDGDDLNNLGNDYTTIYVPVAGYNGQAVRFAIYGGSINNVSSSNDNRCVIDNVRVEEAPSCYPVGTLAEATDITPFSAKLSWGLIDNTQDGWRITYATNADLTENMHAITVTSHENYTLSGLTPETHYYVAVCAFCGVPGYGAASNIIEFTTGIACPAPTNLEYDNASLTQTSVDLSWNENGTATAWKVAYKVTESTGDFTEIMVLDNPSYTLGSESPLTQGTNYTVKVRAICGGDYGNSQWSDEITFMTVASCPAPENLAVTQYSETAHGATITWEGNNENDSYTIEYAEGPMAGVATLLEENFDDSSLPTGWNATTINWSIGSSNNAGGVANELHFYWDPSTSDSRVISPALDLTGISTVTFAFKHDLHYYSSATAPVALGIATSSDGGTTWNQGWSQSYSANASGTISEVISTPDMGNPNVLFCIYFSGSSYDMDDWYFDDITITTEFTPTYTWNTLQSGVTGNSYTINTLDPETQYVVRVKGDCNGTPSPASNTVGFTTLEACGAPTAFTLGTVEAHQASFSWTAGNGNEAWKVYVKKHSVAEYPTEYTSVTTAPSTENPVTINELDAATAYDVKIVPTCDENKFYEVENAFTTKCEAVTIPAEGWTENFDSYTGVTSGATNNLPICWNYINGTSFTNVAGYPLVYNGSSDSYSGNNHLRFNANKNQDPRDQYAVLPAMHDVNTLRINLYARLYYSSYGGTFTVGVMTDPTDADSFVPVGEPITLSSTNYTNYTINLNSYNGSGNYIAIKLISSPTTSQAFFIDDITVEPIPSCVEPSELQFVSSTTTTATLQWIAGGSETAWDIYYSTENVAPTSSTTPLVSATTDNPATINDLTASSIYYVWVRAHCSDADQSPWVGGISFATKCDARTDFPITYGFETSEGFQTGVSSYSSAPTTNNLGNCWRNQATSSNGDNTSRLWCTATTHYDGSQSLMLPDKGSNGMYNTTLLAFPPMNFTSANGYKVSFWINRNGSSSTTANPEGFKVYASNTDTIDASAVELGHYSRNYGIAYPKIESASGWYQYEFYIPQATITGTVYLIFEGQSYYGNATYVDDITIEEAPTCYKPTAATVDNESITTSGATISWTPDTRNADGGSYSILDADDNEVINNITIDQNNHTATLTGLTENTPYTFKVATNCANTAEHVDALTVNFTTLANCQAVTNLEYSDLTATGVTLSWTDPNGDGNTYIIKNGDNVLDGTTTPAVTVNGTTAAITGLTGSTNYTFTVVAHCSTADATGVDITVRTLQEPVTTYPYSNGFETTDDQGWEVVSGTTNSWVIGTGTYNSGDQSLYVSKDGTSYAYNNSGIQMTYVYRTFQMEAGGVYNIEFDWKTSSGDNDYDYMRAWLTPASAVFTANQLPDGTTNSNNYASSTSPEGWTDLGGGRMQNHSSWTSASKEIIIENAGQYNIVFMWAQDNSYGSGTPAAIDNLVVTHKTCFEVSNLHADNETTDGATLTWEANSHNSDNVTYTVFNVTNNEVYATNVTGTSINVTGLNDGTSYEFTVTTNCGTNDNSDAVSVNFTTLEACGTPTAFTLGDVEAHQASFSWTAGNNNTAWKVYVKKHVDADYPDTYTNANAAAATINELDDNTTYDVKIVPTCDDTKSLEVANAFTTKCNPFVVHRNQSFTENFDAATFPPTSCWSTIPSGTSDWARSYNSSTNHSGSTYGSAYSGYYGDIYLVLPDIALSDDATDVKLTFWSYNTYVNSYDKNSVVLLDGDDETELWSPTSVSQESWKCDTVNLSAYKGQTIRLAFKYEGNDAHGWYLDDIAVAFDPCYPVTNLSYDNESLTANTVALSWTPGAETNWRLQYRENGTQDWNTVDVAETDLINGVYTLDQLNAGATYEWQVAAACTNTFISDYTAGANFTTLENCPAPTNLTLTTDSETPNGATITWTAGSTANEHFTVEYRVVNEETWIEIPSYIEETTYTFTTLEPATTYQARVGAVCGTYLSDYSNVVEFTTEANPGFTVTFVAGNSGTCNTTELTGITVELPAATPLQDCAANGWTFAGWTTTELTENTTTAPTPLYEAGTSYTPSASLLMYAVYMRTEGEALPASYNLVTEEPNDWSGDYLIAYATNNVIFNSSQENLDANNALNVSQYWNGNTIASNETTDAQKVTIAATGNGNYSLLAANGKYFGNTSNDNKLVSSTSSIDNTISLDASGNADIESSNTHLRFNTQSASGRFRYFKSTSYTSQQPIQLYRYTSATPVTYAGAPDCNVPVSYNITVTQVQGATITATPSTAAAGDVIQLSIDLDEGYALNQWQVTASTGPVTVSNNSFEMPAANVNVTATLFNVYTVAATAVPANGGTVNGAGSYSNSYNENTEVTLTAAANTGYDFTGWYNGDDQVSENNSYTFTVTENVTLEARFAPRHTVTFNAGNGSCATTSLEGSTIDLSNVEALPSDLCANQGWTFAGWSETSVDETTTAPTLVNTSYSPASDIELYAVYSKTDAGAGQDTWTMATSIAVGDVVVMVYEGNVTKELTGVNSNIGTATDYTVLPAGTYPLTVEQGNTEGTYAFKNNSNYLALTGNNNNLYTLTEKDNRSSWTVTSVSDGFDIKNVSYDTRYLQYNTSSPRFACYTHTQKPVRFYKLIPGDVTTYNSNPNCVNSYVITAEANDATYGTVTGTVGENAFVSGAEYVENTVIVLQATASEGYHFVNWKEGNDVVSTEASYHFTATGARNLVANFELNSYDITVSANPTEGGTVSGAGTYSHGATVTLTATANEGYTFVNWTKGGEPVSTNPTCTLDVTAADAYVAHFSLNSYAVTVTVNPAEGGTVTGAGTYFHGDNVTLTATANNGYHFVNWTENDAEVSTDASYSFTFTGARNLVANFAITPAGLSWNAQDFTGYTMIDFNNWKPTVNNPNNVTLRYGCVEGNVPTQGGVEVDATTGMIGGLTNAGYIVHTPGTYLIYAVHDTDPTYYYDSVVYTLNVERGVIVALLKNIDEAGTAVFADYTTEPTLTHSYSDLVAIVAHGQTVRVQADPATGYHFNSWQVDDNVNGYTPVSTEATYTYTVPDIMSIGIKAVFDTNTYALNVVSANETMGIAAGSTTAKHFLNYEISATPNTGYHFTQWSDGNTQNPRTVTLTENTTYTAEFAINNYTVAASANPAAGGSIEGAGNYNHFANATLTATATTGYTFVNWTEGGQEVSTNATYSFQVTGERELVANFSLNSYAVSTSAYPAAGGTVTGADTYNHGASVTVTATANEGYTFVNWTEGGQVVSTNASYTFTFTGARTLVANFTPIIYTVTFNPGTGTCQTQSLPGSIESSINIDEVTATPEAICGNQDWVFAGWSTASVGETSQAPAFVSGTEYFPTGNITLYAVYTKTEQGEGTWANATSIEVGDILALVCSTANSELSGISSGTSTIYGTVASYTGSPAGAYPLTVVQGYNGSTYAFKTSDNTYLSWSSGKSLTTRSNIINESSWNVTFASGNATISNAKDNSPKLQYNSSSPRFACYSSTQTAVQLYKYTASSMTVYNSNPVCYVYAVNVDQNIEHGSVVADQTTNIVAGTEITLTPTIDNGYHFGRWFVTAGNDPVTVENNKFTMPESNVNVSALFWIDTLTVNVNANPAVGGTVSGAGDYEYGDMVTLNATANTGYTFVNWTENNQEVSADATYEFIFNGEAGTRTFVANFSLNSYEITVSANPTEGGNVNGGNTYNHGATANLTATPATGYHFVNWTKDGDVVSTSANYSFTVAGAGSYVANFELNSYTIAATANPTAGGTVSGAGTYNHFENVTLTATVSNGYDFIGWYRGNDQVATSLEYSFEATEDVTLEARFATRYTITFVPGSHSTSTIEPRQGSSVDPIDIDAVTANPSTLCVAQDWEFAGWSAASVDETTQAPAFVSGTEYVPTDNITLYAVYSKTEGVGSSTASIDFTAQGYTNAQAISDVAISNNVNVTFALGTNSYNNAPKYYSNNVQIPAIRCYGGNTFTVTATDAAITNITLTFGSEDGSNYISPDNGDYSNGTWTGNENSVVFTISGSSGQRRIAGMSVTTFSGTVTYNSDPECFVYDVVVNPNEHGTITADPNTGVIAGTEITLTNTPSEGYHFAGWDVTAGNDPVTVENNKFLMPESDVNVSATFEPDTFTLTINYSIVGGGDAPQSYSVRLPFGTPYSVATPVIAGLTPSQEVVSGTMPAHHETVEVTYSTVPYTLTVHYVYADNTPAAEDEVRYLAYNVPYTVTSPTIEGYTPDQVEVSGTMGEADVEVTVVYSINSHNLTVNYVNEASAQVAESHTATLNYHDNYSVVSPQVAGYAANKSVVSGTMGDADKTETVTYYLVETSIVDATNCAGTGTGSLTVTAPVGNFEYSLDGVTFQSETQFANLNAGDYTLYIRPTGEAFNYSGVWTVNSNITMPVAVASANPFYCLGNEINLSGNGSSTGSEYTYAWSGPNNFTANDINAMIATAGDAHSGTYTLAVTNTVTNCVSEATVDVIVNTPNMNGYLFTIATHGDAYANLVNGEARPVFADPTVQHYLANAGCNVTLSNDAETYHHAGDYTITWTAEDACGNRATTTQVLHVVLGTCPVATDYDGNTYPVVALNNLCWMAANLRTTHYSDSRPVPNLMVYSSDMYPDATANLDMFGYLYDWTAAMDAANGLNQEADGNVHGICPAGWRMPKESEIRALVNDGARDIFDLRTTDQWLNNFGTNTTGFSLLPAGCYNANNDRFENLHGDAYIWGVGTSTPTESRVFWADCKCYNWQIFGTSPLMGFSVRCVKEN